RTPAEGLKRLLVQARPDLLVALPHGRAKTLPRILERHHEQRGSLVFLVLARAHQRQCALPVVDLGFFARQELEHVEALGLARARAAREQRFDHQAEIGFQDVHSFLTGLSRGGVYVPPCGAYAKALLVPTGGGIWGGHEWESLGGRRGSCSWR